MQIPGLLSSSSIFHKRIWATASEWRAKETLAITVSPQTGEKIKGMEPADRISDLVLGSVGFTASVLLSAYQPLWSRYRFISSSSLTSLSLFYWDNLKVRKFLGSFPYLKSANRKSANFYKYCTTLKSPEGRLLKKYIFCTNFKFEH